MRTTIRWLAMPSRTWFESSPPANSLRSSSVSATGSATSPSRTMPGRSSATAPFVTEMFPLTWTSAAARWLGSISSPTIVFSWRRRDLSMLLLSAVRAFGLNARALTAKRAPEGPLRSSEWC